MPQAVLLIHGDGAKAMVVKDALLNSVEGFFDVSWVELCSEGLRCLRKDGKERIAAILVNLFLSDSDGLETFDRIFQTSPDIPILVLSTREHENAAKLCVQRGAQDYLLEDHLDSYLLPKALRNMLERSSNAKALFREKERAQVTLNSIGDAVVCTDASGNVSFLNPIAEDMSGWSVDEAIGRPFIQVFRIIDSLDHRQAVDDPMALVIKTNKSSNLTAGSILVRRDGIESAIEDSTAPIRDRRGRVTGGVMVFRDVTQARAVSIRHNNNERARQRQCIEVSLRHAMDRGEFVLHYQPKWDLVTETLTGAEALIRWRQPERGIVFPQDFIPIAEQCGYIVPIGRWVLREACLQRRNWLDAHLAAMPIAINISAVELRSKSFVEHVRAILQETELEPHYLEFELTESTFMQDPQSTIAVLRALKDMGIQLTLDDFGTGYSSLGCLKRFPINALKIDKSLVQGLCTDSDDSKLVNAAISLGRSFHLQVIAEGVETREQFIALQAQNCAEGQGYYFQKPIAADEFAKLFARGVG
jgi:PAS domain S-box-containing protein